MKLIFKWRRLASEVLLAFFVVLLAGIAEATPAVSSISPEEAFAGDRLVITGTDLKGTREIFFVSGSAVKTAKFKIVSDERLEVVFPEFYRGTGSASIAILGKYGVTVGSSAQLKTVDANSEQNISGEFLNVVDNGAVNHGSGIAVVDAGGILAKHSSGMCFVKNKGTVVKSSGALIFHEAGAIFGNDIQKMKYPPKLITVREITVSPELHSVTIKSVEPPAPSTRYAPCLTSITPARAAAGDIITIQGRNLDGAEAVYFFDPIRGLIDAGFKPMSNELLRVEVPQGTSRRQIVIVKNPMGIGINLSKSPLPPPILTGQGAQNERFASATFMLEYVRSGQIRNDIGGSRIVIIDNGGTVVEAGGSCFFLVQKGGKLTNNVGGSTVLIHETGAMVPPQLPTGTVLDVTKIEFSDHQMNLDVLTRY